MSKNTITVAEQRDAGIEHPATVADQRSGDLTASERAELDALRAEKSGHEQPAEDKRSDEQRDEDERLAGEQHAMVVARRGHDLDSIPRDDERGE